MTSYDQRKQRVNTQFNINFESTEHIKPEDLLKQALTLLESKSFLQASGLLKTAIKNKPTFSTAYYYLAIALLKGRRPKVLKRSEVEEIDEILSATISLGDSDGTILWFRALLRDDYYNGNKMRCPLPSVTEIITSTRSEYTDSDRLRSLLKILPMTDNQLYNNLVKQLF